MLTAADIASLRAAQEAALPETVTISRLTLADNGAGGFSESWATAATVSGRIGPYNRQASESIVAERLGGRAGYTVTLPALTDVREADRLVVGTRTFEVVQVIRRSHETARVVVCAEVL
jgi:head-tail adaptor